MLSWQIYVSGSNKTRSDPHEKCPIFLFDFKQVWRFPIDKRHVPSIKFLENTSCGSHADICRQTDRRIEGRTDMMKLVSTFRIYANAPKIPTFHRVCIVIQQTTYSPAMLIIFKATSLVFFRN